MGVDRLSEGASAEVRTEPASPCVEGTRLGVGERGRVHQCVRELQEEGRVKGQGSQDVCAG